MKERASSLEAGISKWMRIKGEEVE